MTTQTTPATCNPEKGCTIVQVHEERLDEHDHRLHALEEDNRALHKRITDHLLDTINDLRGKVLLVITVAFSAAGLIVSIISLLRR